MSEEIFALDIGTRKVMGIIACKIDGAVRVLDVEVKEHLSRPMFDGQIHSIEEVAATVKAVKENLESRLGRKLTKAGVAVAGRNLAVYKTKVVKELNRPQEVSPELIKDLELEAVDKIISDSGGNIGQFYCVGYSPVYYELDGNKIANLLGHSATSMAVEVIATFLPRVVLDSMFAVLKRTGLEATNITLEPIAAISAIIPAEMRNLNIVLVDIGAGTSDLALTKDGSVFAYGMVAEAGDEITEYISEVLLTDFNGAEQIKRKLDDKEEIEYEDIWLKRWQVKTADIKQNLLPAVNKLSESIAKKGLELNGARPQAVVAVGGGSLTPGLMQELAKSFGLSEDKAGIRLPFAIKNIKDATARLTGPEAVTPIGIALMTVDSLGLRFIDIEVNGKKIRMLDFQQKKDIIGALALSGLITNKRLYPRPGLALTVEVNGELRIIKGTLGTAAKVIRNNKTVVSLSEKIENNDKLEFHEAIEGVNASAAVKDIVQADTVNIVFNGKAIEAFVPVILNGHRAKPDEQVPDLAKIETRPLKVKDVLEMQGVNLEDLSERQILVNINGAPKILTQRNFTLYLNGGLCDIDAPVNQQDEIGFNPAEPTFYRIKDIIEIPPDNGKLRINVDGRDLELGVDSVQIFMNGTPVKPEEFLIDGADIKVFLVKNKQVLLSEIFKYIEFDPYKGIGKNIKITVNERPAGFTTPLEDGSRVKIVFEDRAQ